MELKELIKKVSNEIKSEEEKTTLSYDFELLIIIGIILLILIAVIKGLFL